MISSAIVGDETYSEAGKTILEAIFFNIEMTRKKSKVQISW